MARRLDDEERVLAQAILDGFAETGSWPKFRTVERKLARTMNVEDVLQRLNPKMNLWMATHNDTEVRLPPETILLCDRVEDAFDPLVRAFPLIVGRYFDGEKPEMKSQDFAKAGWTQEDVSKLGRMMFSVSQFTGSGGRSGDGSWHFDLAPETRELQSMTSAREYVTWWAERNREFQKRAEKDAKNSREGTHHLSRWFWYLVVPLFVTVAGGLVVWWLTR